MSHPIEFPRVPSTPASQFTTHDVSVQATITCHCTRAGRVLTIRDHRMAAVCPDCQRQYVIAEVQYDLKAGGISATVGCREPNIVVPRVDVQ